MKNMNRLNALALAPEFYDSFLLKDLLSNTSFKPVLNKQTVHYPAVNIQVNSDAYVLELAAPGLNKKNISIVFEKEMLTVSYTNPAATEATQKEAYSLQEFKLRSFSRNFTFPERAIDEENIKANYQDGILRLELPKREEAKPKAPKKISVA